MDDSLYERMLEPVVRRMPEDQQAWALKRARVALRIARAALQEEGLYGSMGYERVPVLAAAIYQTPYLT